MRIKELELLANVAGGVSWSFMEYHDGGLEILGEQSILLTGKHHGTGSSVLMGLKFLIGPVVIN